MNCYFLVEIISFCGWWFGSGGDVLDVMFYGVDVEMFKGVFE